jgi:catechol 2,3-dioxygenase-like lactoylglutathione lyase family enzyme
MIKMIRDTVASRRSLIMGAGAAAAAWPLRTAFAQEAAPSSTGGGPPAVRAAGPPPTAEQVAAQLPLKTTGLEHVSIWVPDVAEAGAFYGKVFNPALHKEKAPPLRLYVPLSLMEPRPPLNYIAIGAANGRPVQIDHYCALVEDYNPAAMAERLRQEGVASAGRFGMYPDGDGLQLQLLGVPGGLAATTEPAGRISDSAPIVEPIGLENVILQVSDLDHATAYYRRFFSGAVSRSDGRVWIDVAGAKLGLAKVAEGAKPVVSSFCVRVRSFDRATVSRKLEALGGQIIPAPKVDGDVLRFRSPMGLTVDLKSVKA